MTNILKKKKKKISTYIKLRFKIFYMMFNMIFYECRYKKVTMIIAFLKSKN